MNGQRALLSLGHAPVAASASAAASAALQARPLALVQGVNGQGCCVHFPGVPITQVMPGLTNLMYLCGCLQACMHGMLLVVSTSCLLLG